MRRTLHRLAFVLAATAATASTCGKSPTTPSPPAATNSANSTTAPPASGPVTWYVTASGSDSNSGTQAQPFRTIQRAADVVNPGDTVLVGDGTYTGTGTATPCASSTQRPVVCLTRGGTSAAWVTFRSLNRQGAKIDGQSNTSNYGFQFLAGASYIRVEGFEVFGMGNASGDASGFVLYQGGHDVTIARNEIHDIGRLCTDTGNGETGIFIANPRVTVDSNRIHDIGRFAPGQNGCVPATPYYTNHDHGIYINGNSNTGAPGAGDVTVVNNIFWNDSRGWPIQVYPGAVANISILNNTFSGINPYSNGQIIVAANTTNARIVNNIFDGPLVAAINFYSGNHSNLNVDDNLSTLSLATANPPGVAFAANLEGVAPQLDSSFRPASTSPAIDRGASLAEVAFDIVGTTRPQGAGWDLGAYELVKPAAAAAVDGLFTVPRPSSPIR